MKRRQIFILYSHTLFARGVERMLKSKRGLQIVGMEADREKAMHAIGSLHPDVVILDGDEKGLESLAVAKEIMDRSPRTKVIALTARDNKMYLYQTKESTANDVQDLLRAIREGDRRHG
ncbi:MAG: response regulator [Anaerolineae bacterium]